MVLQRPKTPSSFIALRRRICKAVCCARRQSRQRARSRRFLRVTSILPGSDVKTAKPFRTWVPQEDDESPDRWHGACPCCKRPIEMRLTEWPEAKWPSRESSACKGRFAYVINLWGASAEYVLGALVLGHSIKKTGSLHSRICLCADDVPQGCVDLLARIWECRRVEHVEVAAISKLSNAGAEHRFAKVFTKLRAMELIEFEKILVMDIDMLVMSNIDELFSLRAPAAMRRGMNDSWRPLRTGDLIDGQWFFTGKDPSKWSWGQGTGINAGVMLWQPDLDVFRQMLDELSEQNHPEHCIGNGPEQDYLSRFWADAPWTHIGSEYNYQMHQMFLALHPRKCGAERVTMLENWRERIKVVHFSGDNAAKPWQRILEIGLAEKYWPDRSFDAEYVNCFSENFQGYHLWVKRDREWLESAKIMSSHRWELENLEIDEQGNMFRKPDEEEALPECVNLADHIAEGVMGVLNGSLGLWYDAYQELEGQLGLDLRKSLLDVSASAETHRGNIHAHQCGGPGSTATN